MSEIDDILHEHGRAWRSAVDRSLALEADALTDASRRHSGGPRRGRALGISAAVVVVAAVAIELFVYSSNNSGSRISPATGTGKPAPTLSGSPDPKTPSLPADVSILPLLPANVVNKSQISGMASEDWRLTAIDDRASTIDIYFIEGDGYCITPVGIYVRETSEAVLVEAASQLHSGHPVCGDPLKTGRVSIRLTTPLGNRTLLHAPVSSDRSGGLRF